jgi:hypothetical protein
VGIGVGFLVWLVLTRYGLNPVDAKDFFVDPASPYTHAGYLYSPIAADAFGALGRLGFPAFTAIIRAAEVGALAWLTGPVLPIAVLLPPVATELNAANINLVLIACVVLGFRWPVLWTPVLLTKPTMGIGLLWFAWHREWRSLALALGPAAILVLVSLLLQPATWASYIQTMLIVPKDSGWPFPWPIWERAIVFGPILAWAIWTGRRWGVVLAVVLAAPRLYFLSPVMLLGLLKTGFSLSRALRPPDWRSAVARLRAPVLGVEARSR